MEAVWNFIVSFANRHPLMVIGGLFVLLSSISNLSTKKVKVKTNTSMSMTIFLAGLAFMGLDLWQSNSLPIANKNKNPKTEVNPTQVSAELKRKVENYLEALETHDFNRISAFYPSVLDGYFGESKVTQLHVSRRMRQEWKKILSEKFEVLWNTWKYRSDADNGKYIVSFSFKHKYQPKEKETEEVAEDKTMELVFDRNYKIYNIDKATID